MEKQTVLYQGTKPTQGYGTHDVGSDIYLAEDTYVPMSALEPTMAKLDLRTEFDPEKYGMAVVPRSSLSKLPLVQANSFGVLEGDYRGQWKMPLRALSVTGINANHVITMSDQGEVYTTVGSRPGTVFLPKGFRIAQAFLIPKIQIDWVEAENLSDTERGTGGFGSSGAN